MTIKEKIILIFLSIITLGLYPLIVFNKKKMTVATTLKTSEKVTLNMILLRKALGGRDNIIGAEYTYTKVKVFVNNRSNVNLKDVSSIKGISGVMGTSKSVTVIVGKQAKLVAESI